MNKLSKTILFVIGVIVLSNSVQLFLYDKFEFYFFIGTLLPLPFSSYIYYKLA